MTSQPHRQPNAVLAAFSGPCLPLAGLVLPMVVYLPAYYASELGLGLAAVGAAFGAVRMIDMAFDPYIGGVMDRTRSRFGRFRLWLVIGTPILMISSFMLFMAKPGVSIGYLWFWLLVMYGGLSIATLAQTAWAGVLSPEYNQRSRIYGWWQAANIIGIVLVLALPASLPLFGMQGQGAAVAAMGWFIVILMPITVAIAVWKTPEPAILSPPDRSGIKEYLALFRRRSVVQLLLIDLLVGIGPAVLGALFFFYFERVKGFEKSAASVLLLLYFLGGLVGSPFWAWLAIRIGKHRALAASGVLYAIMTLCAIFIPAGSVPAAGALMFLIGVPYAAGLFLLRAMMADVSDEERLVGGIDRMGLLFALLAGTVKVASAISVAVTFAILDAAGFDAADPTVSNGEGVLQVIFTIVPAALSLIASWMLMRFPLTAARHAEIRRALDDRDAQSAPPPPIPTPVSEDLHVRTP